MTHTWHTQRKFEQPDTEVHGMLNCFKGNQVNPGGHLHPLHLRHLAAFDNSLEAIDITTESIDFPSGTQGRPLLQAVAK